MKKHDMTYREVRPPRTEKRKRRLDFESLHELCNPAASRPGIDRIDPLMERAYAAQMRGYVEIDPPDEDQD